MDQSVNERRAQMNDSISEGEAEDFRRRMGAMEKRASDTEVKINVHEQKCASRYLQIIALLAVSIGLNLPGALPHLVQWLALLK